jgi:hypothetical protein
MGGNQEGAAENRLEVGSEPAEGSSPSSSAAPVNSAW